MATKIIELENRTRSVFHFPVVKDGREVSRVVLGDSADRDAKSRDPKLQPNPVVRLTADEYAALGQRNHRALDALVAKGDVQRRELAA